MYSSNLFQCLYCLNSYQNYRFCYSQIKQGGKIPEKYYLKNWLHFIDEKDPGVKVVNIGPGSVINQSFVIKEVGTRINFEIRTENKSINFTVFVRDLPENAE